MLDAFERYDVWRAYVDPQWIDHLSTVAGPLGRQARRQVVHEPPEADRVGGPQLHGRDRRRRLQAQRRRAARGDEHIRKSHKRKLNVKDDRSEPMHTISKDRDDSPRKMDGAMAAVLSWEARGDAIAAGLGEGREPLVAWVAR
jgi:hypothetical protein